LGPKLTSAIDQLGLLLNELDAMSATEGPADVLKQALIKSGYRSELEVSRDPQDEARVENLDALLGQLYEWQAKFPDGTLSDYLAEVTLAAAADEIVDDSGNLSLMTLHTAKGLEFDQVFMIGLEQGTLPHVRAFDEPGGLQEERRLMYVGMTRAKQRLTLSHALQRTVFGSTASMAPSSFLSDIPPELLENVGTERSIAATAPRPAKWAGAITASSIRDNKDLQLELSDRINHESFGDGTVVGVSGNPPKQTAEVSFDSGGCPLSQETNFTVDLFEYQARDLFEAYGVPVLAGRIADTPEEAEKAAAEIGGTVVIKAQVKTGGRGKAGGVKLAHNPEEARARAEEILGLDIKGHIVKRVMIAQGAQIDQEFYFSVLLDRSNRTFLSLCSVEGGVEIEQLAVERPEALAKVPISAVSGIDMTKAMDIAKQA